MKFYPDGSLPRITRGTLRGVKRLMQIVKVPENELKPNEMPYKLVWIGPESESESEKSSEESSWSDDDDIPNIELPVKKCCDIQLEYNDKTKDVKSQEDAEIEVNKPGNDDNEQAAKIHKNKNNRYRSPHNFYSSSRRNFNSRHKKFDNNSVPPPNTERNQYYFQKKKYFNAARTFNLPSTSSNYDGSPWVMGVPPILTPPFSTFVHVPVIKQTLPNPSSENCNQSVGLLGNSPFSRPPHNFTLNRQIENFNDSFQPGRQNVENYQNDSFQLGRQSGENYQNDSFPLGRQNVESFQNDNLSSRRQNDNLPPSRKNDDFPPNLQNDDFSPSIQKDYPPRQDDNYLPNRQNINFSTSRQNDNYMSNQIYWDNYDYPSTDGQRRSNQMRAPKGRSRNCNFRNRSTWQNRKWNSKKKQVGRFYDRK